MSFDGRSRAGDAAGAGAEQVTFGSDAFYAAIGRSFVVMCAVAPVLFAIELLDVATGHALQSSGGIWPRHVTGLDGVLLAPLLHLSFQHVLANSVPLILLGTFVLAAGARRFVLTTIMIGVVSGLGVWLVGDSNSVVVGASGVVFGYFGVLLTRGVVERSWWNITVGSLIALLYGWMFVGMLPTDARVSWQGHLFGFAGGVLAAIVFRRRHPRQPSAPAGSGDTLTLPIEPPAS